jgi:hypothetical protein
MSTEIFPIDEREPEAAQKETSWHDAHELNPNQLYVTSFFGGTARGRMLQFTPRSDLHYSQLQREEVMKLVETLADWLDETAPKKT